ncbi:MAG TPA: Fe-S cluster assembly protein SufD [Bauldia sp.]|nr:Fe-S cluster assembly protein SufD [Bauldia sp.]
MSAETRTIRTRAEEAIVAAYLAERSRLPGDAATRARRDAAFSFFERNGLPHRRVETWKYTDLRTLLRNVAPSAGVAPAGILASVAEADPVAGLDRAQIVVVNGAFAPELSDLVGLDGVTVTDLADVLAKEPARVGRLFDDADDPVIALNTALLAGGVVIAVAPDAKPARPIEIVHLTAGEASASVHTRDVVQVGRHASVRFVESHRGSAGIAYQVNALTELEIGPGAKVIWARLQTESEAAIHLASFVARLERDASLDHLAVNAGAAVARWQGFVTLAGPGGRAGFSGATMLSGAEHNDTYLAMRHAAPHTASRELFKSAVDGRATGAFQGQIVVKPGAQKTDARMMTQALLLSDEAEFAAKPELEIFADDVQCGHGATSGRIDETSLFYLMARGVPRPDAERLLIEAFLDDAIDAAGDEAIGSVLKRTVSAWLAKRGGAG